MKVEGHSSGNPVAWDIRAGGEAIEYFSMFHVKRGQEHCRTGVECLHA